jgi:hypothetical protein
LDSIKVPSVMMVLARDCSLRAADVSSSTSSLRAALTTDLRGSSMDVRKSE